MSVESPRNYPNIVNIFKFLRSTKLRFFESLRDSNNSVNFEVRNGKVETFEILRREILQSLRILSDSSTICSNSKNSLTIGKHDRYETNASNIQVRESRSNLRQISLYKSYYFAKKSIYRFAILS